LLIFQKRKRKTVLPKSFLDTVEDSINMRKL